MNLDDCVNMNSSFINYVWNVKIEHKLALDSVKCIPQNYSAHLRHSCGEIKKSTCMLHVLKLGLVQSVNINTIIKYFNRKCALVECCLNSHDEVTGYN